MTSGEHTIPEPDDHAVAGRYELGPVIGVGSSAVVRRGRDLHDGAPVAVKMFHPGATPADLRQQRQEVLALSQLDHPGLVGLHDAGTEAGRPFVVTDLVEGPTLAERIKGGPLPVATVLRIAADLADALGHVHDSGIIHRDIKPANVLLGDGTQARLADFGISQSPGATAPAQAGCVVGTAAYLAPEQARGADVGPPADVYALGLVLLEAVTGQREYPGQAVESATARLYRRPRVPDGLPEGLTPLLRAMTDDDPAARPEATVVAGLLTPVREPRRTGRHRRPEGDRGPKALAAAALVLAVAGGAAALTLDPTSHHNAVPVAVEP